MSNYIRTLLRFEKERAARRAQGDGEENPAPEKPAEKAPKDEAEESKAGFWTVAGEEDEKEPKRRETPSGAMPLWPELPKDPKPRSRVRGFWGRLVSLIPVVERRRKVALTRASAYLETAHAQLLDSLRAVETQFSAPAVVLAAAGDPGAVGPVLRGIKEQARQKGVRLMVAELVVAKGERVLEGRDPTCPAEPLTLNRMVTEDMVRSWFERATTGQDLLVVEAPSLSQTVDAGLLARACDGLSIVVEPMHTNHHSFETAVERAKASGAFLLGLVMSRHVHWLPHFLRTFFSSYPRLIRQPPRDRSRP